MKWYMGVNTNGIDHYRRMIKAAVISNEKFSNFEPHLVYDGTDHPLIDWLEKRNVTIHPYRVSFHDKIMASSGQKNHLILWLPQELI